MAVYDLTKPLQRKNFKIYCNRLYEKQGIVELAEKKPTRSLSQNSYLHLILSYFAMNKGYTIDEVKRLYYKTLCNADLFVVERWDEFFGRKIRLLRSSRELTTEEMSLSIDRFKDWSMQEADLPLPDADKPDELLEAWQAVNTYEAKRYI